MSSKDLGKFDKIVVANALQTQVINPQQLSQFVIKDALLTDVIMNWSQLSDSSNETIKDFVGQD